MIFQLSISVKMIAKSLTLVALFLLSACSYAEDEIYGAVQLNNLGLGIVTECLSKN